MGRPDLPAGFIVGTVHVPGHCEKCSVKLKVGDRAALWNPSLELFCLRCARAGVRPKSSLTSELVILALLIGGLIRALACGMTR